MKENGMVGVDVPIFSLLLLAFVIYLFIKGFMHFVRDVGKLNEMHKEQHFKLLDIKGDLENIRSNIKTNLPNNLLEATRKEAALSMISRLWKISLRRAEMTLKNIHENENGKLDPCSPQYGDGEEGTRMYLRDVLRAGVKERMRS